LRFIYLFIYITFGLDSDRSFFLARAEVGFSVAVKKNCFTALAVVSEFKA